MVSESEEIRNLRREADKLQGLLDHANAPINFQKKFPLWARVVVYVKKKELFGDFKNNGREWQLEKVRVHDFQDKELGKAIPYGVYGVTNNLGWVSIGIDHDTAYFATASILRWWREMGTSRFPARVSCSSQRIGEAATTTVHDFGRSPCMNS